MLVGDIIKLGARRFKGKPAFQDERRSITFDQVNSRANAFIHALMKMGLKPGDRVAILLYNCVEYNELLFALPKAGFIAVTLNYRLVGRELTYMINNAEATALIFDAVFMDTIESIRQELKSIHYYIMVDHTGGSNAEALNYETFIQSHSTSEIPVDIKETDGAYILYTSGTTGVPKGVVLTHKNIIASLFNLVCDFQPCTNEKLFNPAPLYHCAGQNITMLFAFYGCLSITMSKFDPGHVLEIIKTEQPTALHLVPAMQNIIMNHPKIGEYDFDCLKWMIYGASSMLQSQLKQSMEIFKCQYIQLAGQTEAGPNLTCLRPEDHVVDGPEDIIKRLASAGKEVKLTEVKIVDKKGHEVPPNTPGEQIARGDNMMKEYWKMPEATAATIVDGWLHTGDICMKDEDGYIYYLDRMKDMISRGGENVYPREIEEVIAKHPSVREVAVIGVPDERLQEEIMALIVPKEETVSELDIVSLCKQNLASFKKVRYIQFLDDLPKNPSGKVLKRELREKYATQPLPPKISGRP